MRTLYPFLSPDQWIADLFACKAVQKGGVLRRSVQDVERLVGRDAFIAEIDRRGFRLLENNGQFVILCNRAPVRVLV